MKPLLVTATTQECGHAALTGAFRRIGNRNLFSLPGNNHANDDYLCNVDGDYVDCPHDDFNDHDDS